MTSSNSSHNGEYFGWDLNEKEIDVIYNKWLTPTELRDKHFEELKENLR